MQRNNRKELVDNTNMASIIAGSSGNKMLNCSAADKTLSIKSVLIMVTVLSTILVAATQVTEARYLPTRSDESRLDTLKQLLKTMMDYNQELEENANSNNWSSNNRASYGVVPANHARSSYHKRSPEFAADFPSENDNSVRSLSYAEVPQQQRQQQLKLK